MLLFGFNSQLVTNMKIKETLTDEAILVEIGERLVRRRLEFNLTQAALAKEAGVGKRTLERVEAGATAQLTTIIRLLRVLDLLPKLDQILPESKPGPIEVMSSKGKLRKRASSQGRGSQKEESWTWGDEQ
jgi:transcriptional regulator with XRE-family HTH domain